MTATPKTDYELYGDFLADWVAGMSDFGDEIQVEYSSSYVDIEKSIGSFNITHGSSRSEAKSFGDFLRPIINKTHVISNYSKVVIVTPPGTPREVIGQRALEYGMTIPPITFTDGWQPNGPLFYPAWFAHEWGHAGQGLDDPNGSEYWQNGQPGDPADVGMAGWGLQSTSLTDRIGWNKWITGFLRDSQVLCGDRSIDSSFSIKASSVRTTDAKLLVVPLNESEVLVLESIRATGLNYKLGYESEGLLAYVVNNDDLRPNHSMKLIVPNDRFPQYTPLIIPNAPLKKGESIRVGNLTVTVEDSVDQGDLVRITTAR